MLPFVGQAFVRLSGVLAPRSRRNGRREEGVMERELKTYTDEVVVGVVAEEADAWGTVARELPVRGEAVRIVSGALAGQEAMVEAVERNRSRDRTVVRLRIYGFPWPIEEPAYAVVRIGHPAGLQRPHRWESR